MIPIKNKKKTLEVTVEEMRNFAFNYIEKFAPSKQQLKTYLLKKYLKSKNPSIKKSNILCIGDSLETDILGANQFGLKSLFIANGIHKNQLNPHNTKLSETHLKKFFETQKVIPKYILKEFIF